MRRPRRCKEGKERRGEGLTVIEFESTRIIEVLQHVCSTTVSDYGYHQGYPISK
jgi:hypothetical protein